MDAAAKPAAGVVPSGEALMAVAWRTIADAGMPANPLLRDPRFLWLALALLAIILSSALVLVWLDRWRKRSERFSAQDQLTHFREWYEQGQLSKEEFDRIRAALAPQLRRELDLPAEPPGSALEQKAATPKAAASEGQSPVSNPGNPPA